MNTKKAHILTGESEIEVKKAQVEWQALCVSESETIGKTAAACLQTWLVIKLVANYNFPNAKRADIVFFIHIFVYTILGARIIIYISAVVGGCVVSLISLSWKRPCVCNKTRGNSFPKHTLRILRKKCACRKSSPCSCLYHIEMKILSGSHVGVAGMKHTHTHTADYAPIKGSLNGKWRKLLAQPRINPNLLKCDRTSKKHSI